MRKLTRSLAAALLVVMFAAVTGIAGQDDGPKMAWKEGNWHNKNNSLVDAASGLYAKVSALTAQVLGFVTSEDQLVFITAAPTYANGNTFTVPGDFTAKLAANKVVLLDLGTEGVKFNTVASPSFAAGVTTVNLKTSNLTANLTRVAVFATRNGLWPWGDGGIFSRDYGEPSQATLQAVKDFLGPLQREVSIYPGTWNFTSDFVVPENMILKPMPGAVFTRVSGNHLTINSPFACPPWQCFADNSTSHDWVKFAYGAGEQINPICWGAKGDDATDNTFYITSALNSLPVEGGDVVISPGIFRGTNILLASYQGLLGVNKNNSILKLSGTLKTKGSPESKATDGRVKNIQFQPNGRAGGFLYLYYADRYLVDSCDFRGQFGIRAENSSFNRVTNNYGKGVALTFIWLDNSSFNEISFNHGKNTVSQRDFYLSGSNHNKLVGNTSSYAGDNAYYLYGSHYNSLSLNEAYFAHNYSYCLQNSNYNRLTNSLGTDCQVDENFNLYNSSYNYLAGNTSIRSKLNGFELCGGSCYNQIIGNFAWQTLADYGFAAIAEVDGGGAAADCSYNIFSQNQTDGGSVADFFCGSPTYTGHAKNNSFINNYCFSTAKPNLMLRNCEKPILQANHFFGQGISWVPDTNPTGAIVKDNIYPAGAGAPQLGGMQSGALNTITNGAGGYVGMRVEDYHTLCDASGGAFGVMLVQASVAGKGRIIGLTKIDSTANPVTINAFAGDHINSGTCLVLSSQWDTAFFQSDGVSTWIRIR